VTNILLIEDEVHKRDELVGSIDQFYQGKATLEHVDSVHAAFWAVSERTFDLVILDMALPTFSTSTGGAAERGHDQAMGGIEILRKLKSKGTRSKIIIITQYPEITVAGKRLKLTAAAEALSARYDQDIVGGVLYKYKSKANHIKLTTLLKKLV